MTSASPRPDPDVPSPSPEQHRVAAGQFDRANQVVATGDFDYGIHQQLECCKIDPANLGKTKLEPAALAQLRAPPRPPAKKE